MNKDELKHKTTSELQALYNSNARGYTAFSNTNKQIRDLIDQLDEPEKPVVPSFVAEWIVKCKGRNWTLSQAYSRLNTETLNVIKWLYHEGDMNRKANLFAQAWLAYPNFEVEKEQKYIVKDDKGNILLMKVTKGFGIGDRKGEVVNSLNVGETSDIRLTEKEIKDYDPKYMAFATPVEELEE